MKKTGTLADFVSDKPLKGFENFFDGILDSPIEGLSRKDAEDLLLESYDRGLATQFMVEREEELLRESRRYGSSK